MTHGSGIDIEPKPRRELGHTKNPEWVVLERLRVRHPDDALLEILHPVMRVVDHLLKRVVPQRIDGEVSTPRRIIVVQRVIHADGEALVAHADLPLLSRKGEVELGIPEPEFVHAETLPYSVDLAELAQDVEQVLAGNAVHLDVHVLADFPKDGVTHGSANDDTQSTCRFDGVKYFDQGRGIFYG